METKDFRAINYKAQGDGDRVRTGIAAVFGNIDAVKDVTHPGSFTKTLAEGRNRCKHLWNHDSKMPPIAHILELKEVGRGELPSDVLQYAPDATGGLLVKREYYDVPEASWVLAAIDKEDISEMSFAYDVVKSDASEYKGEKVRNLRELILFDTSDVPYGCNSATLANIPKSLMQALPLGSLIHHLQMYDVDLKAGRRNNGADQVLINTLHDISMSLGCDVCVPAESPKSNEAEAEAANQGTSLDLLKLKSQALTLAASQL